MPHRIARPAAGAAGSWWWAPGRRAWRRRASAERGHEVVLLESNAALGGRSCWPPGAAARADGGHRPLVRPEIKRLGIDCRLGQAADADDVRALDPDIVVLATGGAVMCTTSRPGAWPTAWPSAPGTCWRAASSLPGACWSMTASAPTRARGGRLHRQPRRTGRSGDAGHQGLRAWAAPPSPFLPQALRATGLADAQYLAGARQRRRRQAHRAAAQRIHRRARGTRGRPDRHRKRHHPERRAVRRAQVIRQPGTDRHPRPVRAEPQPALAEPTGGGRFLFRVGDCVSMHNIHGAIYDSLRLCKDF